MVDIVSDADHPSFSNLPKELTAKAIRKYFPVCVACPVGNLSAKPLPQAAAPVTAGICYDLSIRVLKYSKLSDK